ncbi:SAP30-binding protein [Copidosoma floridanum]|uniref:SAP30-binding protein n=1 Tax=Copidosoma floridanum TaxID=29053 RepID=UPI0006C9C3D8|nr:SAP30-binding protein [Copidosoma floridanum]XP_014214580.1 SAP30-binding protein [Copidosoma floridanum]XP_014214581.1 SAP30-binding protein [Copidosoma floridanum]XP_014214582.1 SAP30-binding protein [Copidosoma floridanum]
MSVPSVALASLTTTYTDSEGEEGVDDDFQENSNTPPMGSAAQNDRATSLSQDNSPRSVASAAPSPVVNTIGFSARNNRLVSYFDDTVVSDDEGTVGLHAEEKFPLNGRQPMDMVEQQSPIRQREPTSDGETDAYGVVIPPNPSGQCPLDVQDKIKNLLFKRKADGLDMNKIIQNQKEFRNPSIYEKLIQFCNINELGTNYPRDRFDPSKWSKDSYYDELAKTQKVEMDKLDKAKKDKSKIEIITGTAKRPNSAAVTAEEDAKKRKSKWDQVSTNSSTATTTTKPVIVTQTTLTTLTSTATGTRATVISAFGSLPKKRL